MSMMSLVSSIGDGRATGGFSCCPECGNQFEFIQRPNSVSRIPLILNCKHALCEECIRQSSFATGHMMCPTCKKPSPVPRGHQNKLGDVFPPHFALIGYLMWHKNSPSKKMNFNFVSTGVRLKDKQNSQFDAMEGPSGNNAVEVIDVDMEVDTDVVPDVVELKFEPCPEHEGYTRNLKCTQCDLMVCAFCFVEKHNSHNASHLYKLEELEMKDFLESKSHAQKVLKQLRSTERKLIDLNNFDMTDVEKDIDTCLFNLHARLFCIGKGLKEHLYRLKYDGENMNEFKNKVKSSTQHIKKLLAASDLIEKKQINVYLLREQMENVKNIPCQLVNNNESDLNSIRLLVDDEIGNLENNFRLQYNNADYDLVSIKNFDDIIDDECSDISSTMSFSSVDHNTKKRSLDVQSVASSTNSDFIPLVDVVEPPKKNLQNKETFRQIYLTHINSLHSFFVQSHHDQYDLQWMNRQITKNLAHSFRVEAPVIGETYAAMYTMKNSKSWRRVQILRAILSDDRIPMYKVISIDYGNTFFVSKDKLRKLKKPLKLRPRLATECQLADYNAESKEDLHVRLSQIVADKDVFMKTIRKRDNLLPEVDLYFRNVYGQYDSIRELLGLKTLDNDEHSPPIVMSHVPEIKLFKNSKVFEKGQKEDVIIGHVVDPFKIYVQLLQNDDAVKKMNANMDMYYKHISRMYQIPTEDTNIVVRYAKGKQKQWYRAYVNSVNANCKSVEVFLVDTGLTVNVSWNECRVLIEDFAKIECQAIPLKLTDIQQVNNNESWPFEATNFLRDELDDVSASYKINVSQVEPFEVILFKMNSSRSEVCINALLVQHGLATATGTHAKKVYWMSDDHMKEVERDTLATTLIKQSQKVIMCDKSPDMKSGLIKQVDVIRYNNPELIYLQFIEMRDDFNKFDKELQIFYANEKRSKKSWNVDELCVIYDGITEHYKRAVIKEILDLKRFKVYLYDDAMSQIVFIESVYIYEDYFAQKRKRRCYKCHLANVKPAGDSGKWSQLATEVLNEIFTHYRLLYVLKVSDDSIAKSLAVNVWYCLTIPGNALEPSKHHFISVNKTLVECGVAFALTSPTPPANINENAPECVDGGGDDDDVVVEDVVELMETDVVNDVPPTVKIESSTIPTEKVDWNKLVQIEEVTAENWLPPVPIMSREFEAIITCVESDGCILIRNVDMNNSYNNMTENMKKYFDSISFDENVDWQPKQLCTIKYEGNYYRGTVLNVIDAKRLNVYMVDFGSDHEIETTELHKQIMYPDLPIFINRIVLYDVLLKSGVWIDDDIRTLMSLMPPSGRIVIKGDIDVKVPAAEIYYDTGESLNDEVVKLCPNLMRARQIVALQQNNLSFNFLPILKDTFKIEMFLVNVLKCDEVILRSCDVEHKFDTDGLLFKDIQEHARNQPTLKTIAFNQPCICYSSNNDSWCRSLIYEQIDPDFVLVYYVDYGEVETISIDDLKTIKSDWLHFPVYNHLAKLNVKLLKPNMNNYVCLQLKNLCNQSMLVEIVAWQPLIVNLRDKHGNLSYKHLIDKGILA